MASTGSGVKEVLSKVRVPRRTKQAVAMNKAFEPTATAIMYWDEVKAGLEKRRAKYQEALDKYKARGGTAEAVDGDLKLSLGGVELMCRCDDGGNVLAVDMHVPLEDGIEDKLAVIAEGQAAIWGLSRNEKAMEMAKELKEYVETDGMLKGQHNLVNTTILDNPLLTAASMIPDDKEKAKENA